MATMFGLDLSADPALPGLPPDGPRSTGRRLALAFEPQAPQRLGFPADAEVISDERQADGDLLFQIERDEEAGYLIWGPRYGSNLLGPDALTVRCREGDGGFDAWLRLAVAQLLPFAALLRGLEVLHASAVLLEGRAIALVGRSGAGKTATAASLRRRGALFLTDDVLALERRNGSLIAHPGAPFTTAPGSHEELVGAAPLGEAAELGAVFFLDRRKDGPAEPRFEPILDPRVLIASTFNTVLVPPARLLALLDVCAAIAELRVERIEAGPTVDPDRIGDAIADRVGEP